MTDNIHFTDNGHHYTIVPIENSDEFSVVKDNRFTRRADSSIIDRLYNEEGECCAYCYRPCDIIALFQEGGEA